MLRTAAAIPVATQDTHFLSAAVFRWKRIALALLLSGVLGCVPNGGTPLVLIVRSWGLGQCPIFSLTCRSN